MYNDSIQVLFDFVLNNTGDNNDNMRFYIYFIMSIVFLYELMIHLITISNTMFNKNTNIQAQIT